MCGPLLCGALLLAGGARAQTTNLFLSADNSLIDVEGERDYNMGAVSAIRLKAFQHHVVLKFPTAGFTNKMVSAARLRFYEGNSEELTHVTVSTVQGDWNEGTSGGFATSEGGSCFNYARWSANSNTIVPWAWPGSKFPDVAYGNGFSLLNHADTQLGNDGNPYYEWTVDPDLVAANFVGASYGLAVFESSRIVSQNRTVYSREHSLKPYLTVTWANTSLTPGAITDLSAVTAGADRGEVRLRWTAPANAFAYRIRYRITGPEGDLPQDVPRYLIPYAKPAGQVEDVLVRDILQLDADYLFTVQAVSRSGNTSAVASVTARACAIESIPGLNIGYDKPTACAAPNGYSNAVLKVWAVPETEKVLPGGTFLTEDNLAAGYKTANPVFDGVTVRLRAARNETVAFILGVEEIASQVSGLTVSLSGASSVVTGELSRIGYINTAQGYMPELIRPLPATLATRMDENASSGQKVQQVLVELLVRSSAPTGTHALALSISNGSTVNYTIPVRLNVWDFTLPDRPWFELEMNDYGFPTYLATFNALMKAGHKDRAHVNLVPYGSSRTRMDMYLPDGRLMNEAAFTNIAPGAVTTFWDDFVTAFDPALSGSLFNTGLRQGTPLTGFYLSFHESFPLRYEPYYAAGQMDAYKAFTNSPVYAQTFVNLVSNFAQLATTHHWTNAGFQVYFNNKLHPWDFDEPYDFWDFRALAWYEDLFDLGTAQKGGMDIKYRVDISRPQYHRKQLDGKMDLAVISRELFTFNRLCRQIMERDGTLVWNYSTAADVYKSGHNAEGWCLLAYAFGARGVLPWSTVKYVEPGYDYMAGVTNEDFQQRALYIVKSDGQTPEIYSTLRMKAFRRGAQDCEYLHLAQLAGGYTDGQMSRMVIRAIGDSATVKVNPGYVEDAGTLEFQGLSESTLHILRQRAARIIEGKAHLRITGMSVGDRDLGLTVDNAYTGTSLWVEQSADLTSPGWQNATSVFSGDHVTNLNAASAATPTHGFFRLRQPVGE